MTVRTRVTGSFTRPYQGYVARTLCNGSTFDADFYNSLVEVGSQKTTTDVVTPNFHSLRNKGVIINNPFSSTLVEKVGSVTGSRTVTFIPSCSGTNIKSDTLPSAFANQGSPAWPSWDDTKLRDSAVTEASTLALANVSSAEVAGLVELAELSKTIRMLRHPLENLDTFIREVRQSRYYKRKRSAYNSFGGFMTAEWLRYRYGILPFISTCSGIVKVINTVKRSPRYTARGFSNRSYTNLIGKEVINTSDPYSIQYHNGTKSGDVRAYAGVLYEYQFGTYDRFGLRLGDLPSAAYELVPYSFVVDWFTNLGDYIGAITPKAGVKVLASWTGYIENTVVDTSETYSPKTVKNFSISDTRGGYQTTTTTHKRRWPSVSAGLVTKQIAFDRPSDWNHLADFLSLLVQRLR